MVGGGNAHPPLDSLAVVRQLEQTCDMTAQQAELVWSCLDALISDRQDRLQGHLQDRHEQLKVQYGQKLDFAQLRADLKMLERNDFALVKAENDRMHSEVDKLKQRMREDLNRLQASHRLEVNLEKGSQWDEAQEVRSSLSETDAKMEQQVAQQRASLMQVKLDTMRTLLSR